MHFALCGWRLLRHLFLPLSLSLSPSFPLTRPSSLVRPRPMAPLPSIHPPVFLSFFLSFFLSSLPFSRSLFRLSLTPHVFGQTTSERPSERAATYSSPLLAPSLDPSIDARSRRFFGLSPQSVRPSPSVMRMCVCMCVNGRGA